MIYFHDLVGEWHVYVCFVFLCETQGKLVYQKLKQVSIMVAGTSLGYQKEDTYFNEMKNFDISVILFFCPKPKSDRKPSCVKYGDRSPIFHNLH